MSDAVKEFAERTYRKLGTGSDEPVTIWSKTPLEGIALLTAHLADAYGIASTRVTELDSSVFRVDQADGTTLIARALSPARPFSEVEGDSEILRFLEASGYPAERAFPGTPTDLDGRGVLVTRFASGVPADTSPATLQTLGDLLGRLHAIPADAGAPSRPGGSWHHLSPAGGGREADVRAVRPLLDIAKERAPLHLHRTYDELTNELDEIDLCEDLPQALIHVDLGGPNVLVADDGTTTVIDWCGAGRGPRVLSLAIVGAIDSPASAHALADAYKAYVQLEPEELDRLGGAIRTHSLMLDCWTAVFAPQTLQHHRYGSRTTSDAAATRLIEALK